MQILGTILIFAPGLLLSYLIFTKTDIIKRTVYAVILAVSLLGILGTALSLINRLNPLNAIIALSSLSLLLLVTLLPKIKRCKTNFNKDFWYLTFFSLLGMGWRLWFLKPIKNFGDAYVYASKFIGKAIPDLGFYTGMTADHSSYIGLGKISQIIDFLSVNNQSFNIFLITFVYLGVIYLLFSEYRNKKMAYLGVALLAIGPLEIFHNSLSLSSAPLSYVIIFLLFLLFKSKDDRIFWPTLLLAIVLMFSYYTASMIIILSCVGFIIALIIKMFLVPNRRFVNGKLTTKKIVKILKKILADEKVQKFLLIAIITVCSLYVISYIKLYSPERALVYSSMTNYTLQRSHSLSGTKSSLSTITAPFTKIPTNYYKGAIFFGISAVGWQDLFFLLCGLTFIIHIIRKKTFLRDNLDLLLCLIPVLIVSYGFFHVNLPTRIFNYFAFFAVLALRIPKKYFKLFFALALIFILATGFYVVEDKRMFFHTADEEIEAALWVKDYLQGKIFSDQYFIGRLISNGYYNVTGTADDDPLVHDLFYQQKSSTFLKAIKELKSEDIEVNYIALTRRMRENYILMLDTPQKPLVNVELYETNLSKIYDNGEVRIYEIKKYSESNKLP